MLETADKSTIILISTVVSGILIALSQVANSFMPILVEIYKNWNRKRTKKEQMHLDLDINSEIRDLMHKLCNSKDEIDRVTLWELSNGDKIFKNLHLWKLRFYDEVCKGSVLSVKPMFANQTLNLVHFSDIMEGFKKHKTVLVQNVADLDTRIAREIITGIGAKSIFVTLMLDENDAPVALMIAESVHVYLEQDDEQNAMFMKRMYETAIRLSTKL